LLLTPLVIIPVVISLSRAGIIIPRQERLLQLMLCIQSGTSSAQIIVVSLNEFGNTDLASKVAYTYLYQYLCSFITITLWSTVAMSFIYE
jgi:hypothetical protein